MYESKYRRFMIHNSVRFAEETEIKNSLKPIADGSGVPMYSNKEEVFVDDSDNHTIVIGPTGCKKTRLTVMTAVASVINRGESAVINDPKGEIYRNTAHLAAEHGANVYVLNLRNTKKSNSWNPLAQAHFAQKSGNTEEAIQYINDIAEALVTPALKDTNDRYWIDCAKQLLISLCLMMVDSLPIEYCNITNLIQFCFEENAKGLKTVLSKMDQKSTAAFGLHTVLDLEAEKTKSCIYSTMMSILTPFIQNSGLLNILSGNTIQLEQLGREQAIIYLIYPDEKTSLNFVVNMFFTQCYEILLNTATKSEKDKLSVRVNFIIDEFSNLTAINSFENRISEARSKNIRFFLYIQSFCQLKQKYKENAEAIISNCNNWICFGSKEVSFLNKVSEICGKELDYNGTEHYLISPSNIQYLRKGTDYTEVLIIRQGLYPYVTELPDYSLLDIFKGEANASVSLPSEESVAKFITFDEWVRGISGAIFRLPFAA